MILKTERLILRSWHESDAPQLYELAKDPRVGPPAGWPVHESVENSKDVIKFVFSVPETYAITLKENKEVIGSIGVLTGCHSHLKLKNDECEIGFWIGVPYQNNGYATEACMEIIRHCFEKLNFNAVWCGYYDGNEKSRRVQEKCGFEYVHSNQNAYCDLMGEVRTEHFSKLTFFNYKNRK